MKTIAKIAVSAAMLAGAALATTAPASAGVSVGVSVGAPGVVVGERLTPIESVGLFVPSGKASSSFWNRPNFRAWPTTPRRFLGNS